MAEKTEETQKVDTGLIGKPIEELTPAELAQLSSQLSSLTTEIDTRRTAIKEQVEAEVFGKITTVAKEAAQALGWLKLPKLTLVPDLEGENYTVAYATSKRKGGATGKRSVTEVNGGAITINKISIALGGIAWFKDSEGKEHEGIKDLVKSLKQADGTSEADRCWDISKKGISASDIVIKYHAEAVTLVFNDGSEKLVKVAVEEMKAARATT